MIAEYIDELRGEVFKKKGLRGIGTIAEEMGLNYFTVWHFLGEKKTPTIETLDKIEKWVEKQDKDK